jgi:hypothetical protein
MNLVLEFSFQFSCIVITPVQLTWLLIRCSIPVLNILNLIITLFEVTLRSYRVCFIPLIDQLADFLTKPFHKHRYVLFTRKLVCAGPPSLREGVKEIFSSQSKLFV